MEIILCNLLFLQNQEDFSDFHTIKQQLSRYIKEEIWLLLKEVYQFVSSGI